MRTVVWADGRLLTKMRCESLVPKTEIRELYRRIVGKNATESTEIRLLNVCREAAGSNAQLSRLPSPERTRQFPGTFERHFESAG